MVVTVTGHLSLGEPFNTRHAEQDWLRVNRAQYAGKWVALEGDRLISLGDEARAVLEQARENGVLHPLLVQIPDEPPLPSGGW